MTYDEDLADRIRVALGDRTPGPVEERRMFGGLAFMVGGKMAVAVAGRGGVMVPVGRGRAGALSRDDPHVQPMEMGARVSDSWVLVDPAGVPDDESLTAWIDRGLAATGQR